MIEQFRQVLQDFLAPKLEAINGEIRALSAQLAAQDAKIESVRREIEMARRCRTLLPLAAGFPEIKA